MAFFNIMGWNMKKINIIKENREYSRIIKTCRYYKSNYYVIYKENTKPDDIYKFGISIGKKVGKAVYRNKIKRRIKNILDKKVYKNGFKCIIIVKKRINELSYKEMENELNLILERIDIVKGERYEQETN